MPEQYSEADPDEMFRSRFRRRFGLPFPQYPDSHIQQLAQAFSDTYDTIGDDLQTVLASHRITEASGEDLNRIGRMFGTLGRRRQRGDGEYRRYLMSLVRTFQGRGTSNGIKFAVSAGVGADYVDDVAVEEHPEALEYSLRISGWASHSGVDVRHLADLADPSGVALREPLIYEYSGDSVGAATGKRQVVRTPEPGVVGAVVSDLQVEQVSVGFGSGRFDGLDAFGEEPPSGGFGEFFGGPFGGSTSTQDVESQSESDSTDADADADSTDTSGDDTDADSTE